MDKETYLRHLEDLNGGITRPSRDGDPERWKTIVQHHMTNNPDCHICKARRATRKSNELRRAKNQIRRDLGLSRVRGTNDWE